MKLPLLSRRPAIPKVRFDTRDCEVSPMISLRSFLSLEITGELHGADEQSGGDAMARFWCIAMARDSVGDSAGSRSREEDICSSKKLRSPKDSASGTLAPSVGVSG